jgi:peptide/nickel transport system substrate-binding protein
VSIGTGNGGFTGLVEVQGVAALNQPEGWGIGHAPLSTLNHEGVPIPILAEQLPSPADGTWLVQPDGSMQVTWRLRRDVRWHDGAPFTARDVRFSWEFAQDDALPITRRPSHTNITAIDLPDDYTAVMHWRTTNSYAHIFSTSDLFVYPEHIVRPLWDRGEGERMLGHEFFHGGFVGLGPYRVGRWNPDNSIVFEAFDDYFLGRPRIDRIIFHQFDGSGALLTQMLAGELHMATAYGLNFHDGQNLEDRWNATGEGTVYWTPTSLQRLVLPPENPLFADVRVRRALLLAIDREELNRELLGGKVVVAHSLLHPNEPGYAAANERITRYAFDPSEAVALLRAAGWQRGSDGVLTNEAGDRFEVAYRVPANNQEALHVQGAIGSFWQALGVRTTFEAVPRALFADAREAAQFRGVSVVGGSTTVAALFRRWHSSFIPTAANRYLGDNLARWASPGADRLLERIDTTLDSTAKERALVELAMLFTEELPCLPLYYQAEPVAIHRSLRNARPRSNSSGQNNTTWDCYQWELA